MESLIDQILFLQKVPIFKDLTVEQLGEIASISVINEYEEDEFLFREGDVGYNAYILISGKVEIFKTLKNNNKIIVAEMVNGDYFGEMAIFDGEARTASAKTVVHSIIMSYSKENMDDAINKYPSIALRVMNVMSKRMRDKDAQLKKYEQFFLEFKKFSNKISGLISSKKENDTRNI